MRAVNLLPRDTEREGKDGRGKAPLFAAAAGIAAVTVGAVVVFMSASGSASDQRAQLDSVESAIARMPDAGHPTVASGAIAQARADRVAALSAALTTRVPLDRLLRELAYVLPDDAWLTGLSAAAPESATPGTTVPGSSAPTPSGAQGVTIQGATYSNASVARVLARLAATPSLERVQLAASVRVAPVTEKSGDGSPTPSKQTKKEKQRTIVTFTIAANLRSGAGS
jgi:Tfp pilus assembly protein PilN